MEPTAEIVTLWHLLSEPSLTLQLPRFSLFLFISIILEIICSKKKICLLCSASTVSLLMFTGIGGIIAVTLMISSHIYIGTRVAVPIWYYPVTAILILGITLAFLTGVKFLLRRHLFSNAIIRCLIFGITVYFAVTTIITPTRVNRSIAEWEKTAPSQQFAPPSTIETGLHIQLRKEHLLNRTSLIEKIDQDIWMLMGNHIDNIDRLEEKIGEGILIQLNEEDEHLLNWDSVEEILMMCSEQGFTSISINDFKWKDGINERRNIPRHSEETDTLIIPKSDIDHSKNDNSSATMSPVDQYEWDQIHAWCKRNNGKHATISFGSRVAFDVLEEVVRIFDAQGITFDLSKLDDSPNPECHGNIKLELFTHTKPEQVPMG